MNVNAPIHLRMRNVTFGIFAIMFAMASGEQSAFAAKYKSIKYGSWAGGVYINDQTGEFSHCVVSAKYKSGINLLFSVTRGLKWKVGFSKPSWNLGVGKLYPVRYQVDKQRVFKGKARASTKRLAIISLPGSSKLFKQMRRGRVLRVEAGVDILAFNLTGTNRMLRRLLRCAQSYEDLQVAPNVTSQDDDTENPFKSSKKKRVAQSAASTGIAPRYRQEARQWFASHLADAPEAYSIVANEGKAQKMYQRHALIWRVGKGTNIIGTLRIFPRKKQEAMESSVLAYEARTCKGDFASRFFKNDGVGSSTASRLMATCQLNSGKIWSSYYLIDHRKAGGSYLVTMLSGKASSEDVADAGERLTGVLQLTAGSSPVSQQEEELPNREDDDVKEF